MRNLNLLSKLKEQPEWLLVPKRGHFTAVYLIVIVLTLALCIYGCALAV